MPNKNLYALLVGINKYDPTSTVPPLSGCEKDIRNIRMLLEQYYGDAFNLHIKTLMDEEATYDNLITNFRKAHLQKEDGNSRDVILFYYSGHGSREKAAAEFRDFFPDGFGETLVCHDSRKKENGKTIGNDLADKELAVLISELDAISPHVVVVMDCCHAGGGTRDTEHNDEEVKIDWNSSRQTSDRKEPRLLKTYLNGWFEDQLKREGKISIPKSKHILLAACTNKQQAFELQSKQGLFTNRLLKVLLTEKQISYASLFSKARLSMRRVTKSQDPQFETYEHFNGTDNFLNHGTKSTQQKHLLYFEDGQWWVNCGAVHGLPTDEDKKASFAIFDGTQEIGFVEAQTVGIQKSSVEVGFSLNNRKQYEAILISLPSPPVLIKIDGNKEGIARVQQAFEKYTAVHFEVDSAISGAQFGLIASFDKIEIWDTERHKCLRTIEGNDETRVFEDVFEWLEHLAQWEKAQDIANTETQLKTPNLNFLLTVYDKLGKAETLKENDVTLYTEKEGNGYRKIRFDLRIENNCGQDLHCSLFYFSPDYGVHFVDYREIPDNRAALFIQDNTLELINDNTQSTELLKVFVGTKKMDDFLLELPMLEIGETVTYYQTRSTEMGQARAIGSFYKEKKKILAEDWFAKTLKITTIGK